MLQKGTKTMAYEFDPTGLAPANLILNEEHVTTTTSTTESQFFVASAGPFFANSFKIYDKSRGTFLRPNIDYVFGVKFDLGSSEVGEDLFMVAALTKPTASGIFSLTYQTLGGAYVQDLATILEDGFAKLDDLQNIRYEDIAPESFPETFPPTPHNVVLNDMDGYTAMLQAMQVMTETFKSRTTEIKIKDVVDLDIEFVQPIVNSMANIASSLAQTDMSRNVPFKHYSTAGLFKDVGITPDGVWMDTDVEVDIVIPGQYMVFMDPYLEPLWAATKGKAKARTLLNGQAISSHSNLTSFVSISRPSKIRMQIAVFGADVNSYIYGDSDDMSNLTAIRLNGNH